MLFEVRIGLLVPAPKSLVKAAAKGSVEPIVPNAASVMNDSFAKWRARVDYKIYLQ